MPVEIERKFLVTGDAWRRQARRSVPMHQGYLTPAGAPASVRVRLEGEVAHLNIKAAIAGPARAEYEYAIDPADAREMLARLCVGHVAKVRHYVEHGGLTWEVDVFEGDNAGLVVAEVELEQADQRFDRPAWAGREVTDEPRYYNHALALHPYRSWPRETP